MATKRKDKSRVVLKTGEVQRKDGTYQLLAGQPNEKKICLRKNFR